MSFVEKDNDMEERHIGDLRTESFQSGRVTSRQLRSS